MKGIKMSECKFYVNEEERTVVCVIPCTRLMLFNFIREHFRFRNFDLWAAINDDDIEMPYSFMGKAVCSQEDEWNEELGRMIAFSRAKDKCYKSFFRRANRLVQIVDARLGEIITLFNDFGAKLDDKRAALEVQIEEKIQK